MVAVRRSLFNTEGDRKRFLGYILRGVCEILKEEAGFTDEQCFHNFAKLLSKVRPSGIRGSGWSCLARLAMR